jgi:SAM-dependent methyltransferase
MSKAGERAYLGSLGEEGIRHSLNKPFSDDACAENLMRLAAVFSLLPAPPLRILDVGCGTGWTSVFLARRGYDVVGIDISAEMIEQAAMHAERLEMPNLCFRECDYEECPYRNEFDAALFFDSLHHALDERQALRTVFEALRPGGLVVATEPGEGHSQSPESVEAMARFDVTEKDMPPRHIIALAKEVGFRQFFVFPPVQENQLVPYKIHQVAKEPAEEIPGMEGMGKFKTLFHRVIRSRFGFSRRSHQGMLSVLPILHSAFDPDERLRHGMTVLVK